MSVDLIMAENIENYNLDTEEIIHIGSNTNPTPSENITTIQSEPPSTSSPPEATPPPQPSSENASISQIYPKSAEPPIEPSPSPLQNKMVTKDKHEIVTINGWTKQNQTYFRYCLHRLKYYRIINNFFFFELKKIEGHLSWAIIVLSSFSSVLSLVNTNENIFPNSIVLIKWGLVLLTLLTTLIGSYIKKQQFIDRINNIDRYLQQLNHCVEELNITFILEPNKRESYDEFCKKYIPLIKNLSVSPASFSPSEWKRTVYIITKHYPELIHVDGSNEELLWPWFYMEDNETINKFPENKKRAKSEFGEKVLNSFQPV